MASHGSTLLPRARGAPSVSRRAACRAVAALVLLEATGRAAEPFDPAPLAALARRAGLRVVAGRHLTLVTDVAARDGDGIDELTSVFDDAVPTWCRHFGLVPESLAGWHVCGCLVEDRERFRSAGLLPPDGSVPEFVNGFSAGHRFWLAEQTNPAYRRHLLLHEGVHSFMATVREASTPPWYTEGIAELLATHRLVAGRFEPTPIPARAADVEQLGRIDALRRLRGTASQPSLSEVVALPPALHAEIPAYAAAWAAVALLSGHPRHAGAFARTERGALDGEFTARLIATAGFDARSAGRDFDAFLDDIDYGYDLPRMAIDWMAGPPLAAPARATVAADRGWQNAGVSLAAGRGYRLRATGRCRLGSAGTTALESEPDGISFDWYRGRPIGRLLAAQWRAVEAGRRPAFEVLATGAGGKLRGAVDGPLFLRVNDAPGALADNRGGYDVEIAADR